MRMLQRIGHRDVARVADNVEALDNCVRRQHLDAHPVVGRHLDLHARSRLVGNPSGRAAATIDLQHVARIGRGVDARQDVVDIAGICDRLSVLQRLECGRLAQAVRGIAAMGADPILLAATAGNARRIGQRAQVG